MSWFKKRKQEAEVKRKTEREDRRIEEAIVDIAKNAYAKNEREIEEELLNEQENATEVLNRSFLKNFGIVPNSTILKQVEIQEDTHNFGRRVLKELHFDIEAGSSKFKVLMKSVWSEGGSWGVGAWMWRAYIRYIDPKSNEEIEVCNRCELGEYLYK